MPERITVIGVLGARTALEEHYDLVVGGRRQVEGVTPGRAVEDTLVLGTGGATIDDALNAIATIDGQVCVLASGDPGFFGIVRALAARFGSAALDVRPAPSSVSVAFARLGLPWDDAVVVSAHGRAIDDIGDHVRGTDKIAVLCSPDAPPELVAKVIVAAGVDFEHAAVAAQIGTADESLTRGTPSEIASGAYDPLAVLVLWQGDGVGRSPSVSWGRHEREFAHRAGMITKSEVRAVVLAKLVLPATGVLWDVGAGSGSVGIDAALLAPGVRIIAIERDATACEQIRANAMAAGVDIDVVCDAAPDALAARPDPDRVFVGGGGLDVLDVVLARLAPDGVVVATYAAMDRAAAAYARLGALAQISVARGEPLAGGVRLAPLDPVFVCWGPV